MGDSTIKLYFSSVTGNSTINHNQQHIKSVLTSKKIAFEEIDISLNENQMEKQFMQENAKQPDSGKPLPPQLFVGNEYIGDHDDFENAVEEGGLLVFLKQETAQEKEPEKYEEKLKLDEIEKETEDKEMTIEELSEENVKNKEENKVEEKKNDRPLMFKMKK